MTKKKKIRLNPRTQKKCITQLGKHLVETCLPVMFVCISIHRTESHRHRTESHRHQTESHWHRHRAESHWRRHRAESHWHRHRTESHWHGAAEPSHNQIIPLRGPIFVCKSKIGLKIVLCKGDLNQHHFYFTTTRNPNTIILNKLLHFIHLQEEETKSKNLQLSLQKFEF